MAEIILLQRTSCITRRKPSIDLLEFDKPVAGTPNRERKSITAQSQPKPVRQPSSDLFCFDQTPPKLSHAHAHSQPPKQGSHTEINLLGSPGNGHQKNPQNSSPTFDFGG